jgi:hypothetical protein
LKSFIESNPSCDGRWATIIHAVFFYSLLPCRLRIKSTKTVIIVVGG